MLGQLLLPEIQALIQERDLKGLRQALVDWDPYELADLLEELSEPEDVIVFRILPREQATRTFEYLPYEKQEQLIEALAQKEHRLAELLNDLSPDDRTSLLEELPGPVAQKLIALLSPRERRIALMLLGYPEDSVGRLMTPDYVAVRSTWTVDDALRHIRRFGQHSETLNIIYIVDEKWHLLDDLHIRELLLAEPEAQISELMDGRFVALIASDDQETAVQIFRDYDRIALPVTDTQGVLLGIVTFDDVMDVAEEEATEDIQKIGGLEALEEPYISISLGNLVHKRAKWLVLLFLGEMLTTFAMGRYEAEIQVATFLALFVPLIISSGGNSGSQATTLVIRALAIGEIHLRDWWRVMRREILSGLSLGSILGVIGVARIGIEEVLRSTYGSNWLMVGLTVGLSLLGVVLLGTLAGSMLPFLMKRLGADPATSSAPFVATLVDVAGVVIYFTIASILLSGTLL